MKTKLKLAESILLELDGLKTGEFDNTRELLEFLNIVLNDSRKLAEEVVQEELDKEAA